MTSLIVRTFDKSIPETMKFFYKCPPCKHLYKKKGQPYCIFKVVIVLILFFK